MKWRIVILAVLVAAVAAACAADTTEQPSGALPTNTSLPGDGDADGTSDEPFDAGDAGTLGGSLDGALDGAWVLVSGVPVVDGFPVTLTVTGSEVGGRSACNSYGGSLDLDAQQFTIGELAMTGMACEPAVMTTESAYFQALAGVTAWSVVDGQLHLTGPSEDLVFDRAAAVPTEALVGTTWILDTVVEDDMAFLPVGDQATLVLDSDGTLSGSTGCRTLTGTWIESGAEIVFTNFAADGECPPEIQDQDNRVVTVLGDGFTVAIDGDLMSLTSMGNEGLLYRAAP